MYCRYVRTEPGVFKNRGPAMILEGFIVVISAEINYLTSDGTQTHDLRYTGARLIPTELKEISCMCFCVCVVVCVCVCGVAWHGVAWRYVAWCGVAWRGVVWCGVVCHGMVCCGVV